jgi:hypothetical protein
MMHYGRLLVLCLASICCAALAEAPCPATFAGWVNIGNGSCAIPGLGTISNVRFSGSATGGGPIPTIPEMTIDVEPASIFETFALPGQDVIGQGNTSTFNFGYKLTLDAGLTITGANIFVGFVYVEPGGAAVPGSVGGLMSLCLNGDFTGFPATSCSGAMLNVNAPTVNLALTEGGAGGSATFSASTSVDVITTATGSGSVAAVYPVETFTLNGQPSQPLPTISSVVNTAGTAECGNRAGFDLRGVRIQSGPGVDFDRLPSVSEHHPGRNLGLRDRRRHDGGGANVLLFGRICGGFAALEYTGGPGDRSGDLQWSDQR